ncbi:MAG: Phosphomannomutase/phosphoglucomutase [bacterium ADurb.Bin400]|nr:MAG: Phosphomannomutase/phosphoglucomutase [bacterium ADurb.Bin400]
MEINQHIFRGYDIRGVAGQDLDAETMRLIGRAHGTYLHQIGVDKVVVGSDNRLTAEEYRKAVMDGLAQSGMEVLDLGTSLTSIVYWAQYHFQSRGGVMVTASHNPAEYNGVKLGRDYSDTLTPIDQIKRMVLEKDFFDGEGSVKTAESYLQDYYDELLGKVGKLKKFKVVVDASNGTAGKFMPELLRQAGCEVIEQNCELDGSFPSGTPDPTEGKVARRLAERVVKEGADIGFSYDADGDRMGLVDEKGNIIWNDVLVAIFADDTISQNPGAKIVYNALCSKVVDDVISAAKGEPIMWKTGHAFIKEKVNEVKAPFGGELSGHFYFMDKFYGHDDGAYASLRVLDYLTRRGKKLSEIIAEFPRYISSPEVKIGCPDDVKWDVVKRISERMIEKFGESKVNTLDGARVDFDDGMIIVRASQNGPYLTVKFEAKEEVDYTERRNYIKTLLKECPEIDWSHGVNVEQLL